MGNISDPGSRFVGTDGTEYLVVDPADVGTRPRWYFWRYDGSRGPEGPPSPAHLHLGEVGAIAQFQVEGGRVLALVLP